jgi:hypothetical protein
MWGYAEADPVVVGVVVAVVVVLALVYLLVRVTGGRATGGGHRSRRVGE